MAVGKGSMARASKAADNTSVSKETKTEEPVVKADQSAAEEPAKKAAATATKRTATNKTAAKTTATKTTAKTKATTSKVISGTSEEVMHMIEYQKSNQVLDREPEENETFGVGDAMPIYFF